MIIPPVKVNPALYIVFFLYIFFSHTSLISFSEPYFNLLSFLLILPSLTQNTMIIPPIEVNPALYISFLLYIFCFTPISYIPISFSVLSFSLTLVSFPQAEYHDRHPHKSHPCICTSFMGLTAAWCLPLRWITTAQQTPTSAARSRPAEGPTRSPTASTRP